MVLATPWLSKCIPLPMQTQLHSKGEYLGMHFESNIFDRFGSGKQRKSEWRVVQNVIKVPIEREMHPFITASASKCSYLGQITVWLSVSARRRVLLQKTNTFSSSLSLLLFLSFLCISHGILFESVRCWFQSPGIRLKLRKLTLVHKLRRPRPHLGAASITRLAAGCCVYFPLFPTGSGKSPSLRRFGVLGRSYRRRTGNNYNKRSKNGIIMLDSYR